MKFYSTKTNSITANFEDAIFKSLPPDNGLYFPEIIPSLDSSWLNELKQHSKAEIGYKVASQFVGDEIPADDLFRIVEETVDFDLPLTKVTDNIFSLELFHGPTWAFKDMGARFLSRCMGYFTAKSGRAVTILVATSGDTGSAVAAGFHNVPGVEVKILYPKGKVSEIQKKQLTTWGDNIKAFEVDGTFDDCQALVKQAFLDDDLNRKLNLSSANSINIARLIPQSFYYFYAMQQVPTWDNVVVAVPSGNYGNITAGLMAWKMGLPISRFIAASNSNHVVPDYLITGEYVPRPSVQTYANAMDVGDPSNFVRMVELFNGSHAEMTKQISGFSMEDSEILQTIKSCKEATDYLLDPHGSIGFQSLVNELGDDETGIFLETAHPVKFLDVVEKAMGHQLDFGDKVASLLKKEAVFDSIGADFEGFKERLI
ncbi:MAG: threonine synthase [Cyclobacteriaceae bacterium]